MSKRTNKTQHECLFPWMFKIIPSSFPNPVLPIHTPIDGTRASPFQDLSLSTIKWTRIGTTNLLVVMTYHPVGHDRDIQYFTTNWKVHPLVVISGNWSLSSQPLFHLCSYDITWDLHVTVYLLVYQCKHVEW